eukprot:TRINITY_DN67094_c10_g2_i1.p2 TRINITY_DN67094_c10_g2~~TRINITY_DN67094_c10_g2_i1.p2  ORF type:complete len:149 (+),score=19.56 TRINITY_DN67094_c10_g2_i1:25-447(+)
MFPLDNDVKNDTWAIGHTQALLGSRTGNKGKPCLGTMYTLHQDLCCCVAEMLHKIAHHPTLDDEHDVVVSLAYNPVKKHVTCNCWWADPNEKQRRFTEERDSAGLSFVIEDDTDAGPTKPFQLLKFRDRNIDASSAAPTI